MKLGDVSTLPFGENRDVGSYGTAVRKTWSVTDRLGEQFCPLLLALVPILSLL